MMFSGEVAAGCVLFFSMWAKLGRVAGVDNGGMDGLLDVVDELAGAGTGRLFVLSHFCQLINEILGAKAIGMSCGLGDIEAIFQQPGDQLDLASIAFACSSSEMLEH